MEQDYGIIGDGVISNEELDSRYRRYFTYNIHYKLSGIVTHPLFLRATHKYRYFLKLDIQNFFGSIYTHSLTWAIVGDKNLGKGYAKDNLSNTFASQTDNIQQKGNNNETNGILIGPEVNRVIADIILSQCDFSLETILQCEPFNYIHKLDYEIFRFVDDYYIFGKTKEVVEIIEEQLVILLLGYNLRLNTSKKEIQEAPFSIVNKSIINLKKMLSVFLIERKIRYREMLETSKPSRDELNSTFPNFLNEKNIFNYQQVLVSSSTWLNMYEEIQSIVSLDKQSKRRVILYYLKSVKIDLYMSVFFKVENNNDSSKRVNSYIKSLYSAIESITNIFQLHIDADTTDAYIKIMMKLKNQVGKLIERYDKSNSGNKDIWVTNADKILNNIEDKIFENTYRTVRLNINELTNITNLIVFLKGFRRKISTQQLCAIIEKNRTDYFTLCSVAYYIQDSTEPLFINKHFQVVLKKLYTIVTNRIESYSYQTNKRLEDANFFYLLNDFTYYPPFKNNQNDFKFFDYTLTKELDKIGDSNSKERVIYNLLVQNSYYDWYLTEIDFEKLIIHKLTFNQSQDGY